MTWLAMAFIALVMPCMASTPSLRMGGGQVLWPKHQPEPAAALADPRCSLSMESRTAAASRLLHALATSRRLQPLRPTWRLWHTGTVPRRHRQSLGRCSSRPGPTVPVVVTHVRWETMPHAPTANRFGPLVACFGLILLKAGAKSVLQAPPEQTPPSLWSRLRSR
jgi:hypothetical protein